MRKYFLGGNTPKGFYSYYDYLIPQKDAKKVYILKGGPGTGKSTLMKKIALYAEDEGFDVDYIYCSSDPESLDGLVIREMQVAFVDGTSPHIVDPKTPGAVDTIINLGNFWNEKNMKKNKSDILNVSLEISDKFDLAYDHLKAAGVLHSIIRKLQSRIYDEDKIKKYANEIIYSEIGDISGRGNATERKLFASSYGPYGYITHGCTIGCSKKYVITGDCAHVVTKQVAKAFLQNKYDIETFYNPIAPDSEILHIFVPELNIGIFTGEDGIYGGKTIELSDTGDFSCYEKYGEEIENCRCSFDIQIREACKIIKQAKNLHDKLEGYYIPNMDFAELEKTTTKILDELGNIK